MKADWTATVDDLGMEPYVLWPSVLVPMAVGVVHVMIDQMS